jgi:hypothetical protein
MKRTLTLMLCLLAAAGSLWPAENQVPGQKPLVIIADTFQFTAGSWARYHILDKKKNETYIMSIAILNREPVKGKPCSWLEVEVLMKGQPRVVTRILAEETKQGPGEIQSAIVQVQGYDPFSVPKKFLKPDKPEDQVAPIKTATVIKKLQRRPVGPPGRQVQAWDVEAVTQDGQDIRAVVSEEIPPIAVYDVESPDMRMTAEDWGLGAKTKIEGTPIPFWLWLLDQIGKGLDSGEKK